MYNLQKKNGHTTKKLLIFCALLYALFTCTLALTRLYTYKASIIDMGPWDQLFWNSIHNGSFFFTINPPYIPQNYFGWHFSPAVLLLLPFYTVWPHWELFQIAQSLYFGGSGIILFYALKAAGAEGWEAWSGVLLYWLNPFVVSAAIWDFHEIAFSTILIATALWALAAKRFAAMVCALLLLLTTKEQYGLTVAGFGFLWGFRHNEWQRGILLMVSGTLFMAVLLTIIMPALHGGTHPMLSHSHSYADRYGWMGDPWSVKIKMLYHLMFNWQNNSPGIIYLLLLFVSGLMLPLAAPLYLIPATADIAANTLSTITMPRLIIAYHSAPIIPIVIVSAYQGYRWIIQRNLIRKYLLLVGLAPLAITICSLDLLPFKAWELNNITLSHDTKVVQHIRDILPTGGISAQSNIGMFFSQREFIYPFPHGIEKSNAVILYFANPFSTAEGPISSPYGELPIQYFSQVHALMQDQNWHVAYWQNPWLVMERRNTDSDENTVRADIMQRIINLEKTPH